MKTSVIIPTYHRPDELRTCLESILVQTVKPDEVLVIDDGALDAPPLRKECEADGIAYVYHRKDTPGLTQSRNKGVALSSGDIVFFLDDDTVLLPDYVEKMLAVYAEDPEEEIGGVGGDLANPAPFGRLHRVRLLFDVLFMNKGLREGRVLPSGFCTEIGQSGVPARRVVDADFLPGGICSYRRKVFDDFTFTDGYRDLGLGEDKDFSFQVSRRYKLKVTPFAKLHHLEASAMRPDSRVAGRKFVIGRYLFFRDHMKRGWWSWLFFYYAVLGYLLIRTAIMVGTFRRSEVNRVAGICGAIRDTAFGKKLKS